jgi:hypothetical protein
LARIAVIPAKKADRRAQTTHVMISIKWIRPGLCKAIE